jgi:hypothetical protein
VGVNLNRELLVYAGLVLLAVIIVFSLVKKAFKLVLFMGSIIVLISLYNIVIRGVSPIEQFNAYKTNIKYGKDIAEYTVKIKASTDKIKGIIESKKLDEATYNTLKLENENLVKYQKEVRVLEHSPKLNTFHNNYCGYLDKIVDTTSTAVKLASTGNKTLQGEEDILNKLKGQIGNLSSLKITDNK